MATIQRVIESLKASRAYERRLDDDSGMERVSPAGDDWFKHSVSGRAAGGWGGTNNMPIEVLSNGRWPQDGWQLSL